MFGIVPEINDLTELCSVFGLLFRYRLLDIKVNAVLQHNKRVLRRFLGELRLGSSGTTLCFKSVL